VTDVALRDHLERLIEEMDCRWAQRFEATQTALNKAELALGKRLDGMNEFRDTLRDQAARFVTLDVMNTRLEAILTRLVSLEKSRDQLDGRILSWGSIFMVLNIGLVVLGLWLKR